MKLVKLYIMLLLGLTGGNVLKAQSVNDSVFSKTTMQTFLLQATAEKKIVSLKNLPFTEPLLLFVFLSPECPLCKNYTPVLNVLQQKYGPSVKMIGIIAGRTYSSHTINEFAKKYKTVYPLLVDQQKKLTNYLHASVTPEVILLNNRYELVYKGAIDNRVKALGISKSGATENYLTDAIAQYINHTAIAVKRTTATGCLINDF